MGKLSLIKKYSRTTFSILFISLILLNSGCNGLVNNQLSPTATPPKIEAAGIDSFEFLQLSRVLGDLVIYAKTSANPDQKNLLNQIESILRTVTLDPKIVNILSQKTNEEEFILAMLEGTVGALAQSFLGIPSEIAAAYAKGIGELSSRISQWWATRKM